MTTLLYLLTATVLLWAAITGILYATSPWFKDRLEALADAAVTSALLTAVTGLLGASVYCIVRVVEAVTV